MTQLPTGGGKTEIAGALLKDYLREGRKAVWLTHREELANQTEERLSSNWSVPTMSGTGNWRPRRPAPRIVNGVVILKAQTVSRRNKDSAIVWDNYGPDDLLVIDEAHHAPATGWERAIKQWPGKVWGLTATPWRLSLRDGFDHLFHTLVTGPQTAEMQSKGYLANSQAFAPKQGDRIAGGEVGTTLDYTEGGIKRANDDGDDGRFIMTTLAVNFWRNNAAGRQTVAYAVSKGHADNLVREFINSGVSAAAILSDTSSDDRERAIEDFKNGRLMVLVNVAVATEGFDLPDASCVMITRPTKSLALYLQMVGRGLRPKGDGDDCLILDLAGNAEEHGLPEDYREWSLAARGDPPVGDPPVRYCHQCNYLAHPARHKCPQCDADLGKPCLRCGKFRPWSRWTDDCPAAHEAVCDRCHDDIHSKLQIGRFNRGQDSSSYAKRAEEFRKYGNLEAALADLFFAVHVAKTENNPDLLARWHTHRAAVHAEMGNIDLAEADFSDAESFAHEHRNSKTWYDEYVGRDDSNTILKILPLLAVHAERAKMYEDIGRPEDAELDRQKMQELQDALHQASTMANEGNV